MNVLYKPAASFSEVRDRGELSVDGTASKPAVVEVLDCLVRVLLLLELDIDVADQMVSQVVTHIHLLHRPILVFTLNKHVFKEVVIMLLQRENLN